MIEVNLRGPDTLATDLGQDGQWRKATLESDPSAPAGEYIKGAVAVVTSCLAVTFSLIVASSTALNISLPY